MGVHDFLTPQKQIFDADDLWRWHLAQPHDSFELVQVFSGQLTLEFSSQEHSVGWQILLIWVKFLAGQIHGLFGLVLYFPIYLGRLDLADGRLVDHQLGV